MVRSSEVMFEIAGPRFWKASFAGAKIVTLWVFEKVDIWLEAYSAPSKDVRLKALTVSETLDGGMRRESITWTTPPLNERS